MSDSAHNESKPPLIIKKLLETSQDQKNMRVKKLIFFLAMTTNLLTNVPCGIIPASIINIQTEFKLDKVQIGLLGSLVYIGVVSNIHFLTIIIININSWEHLFDGNQQPVNVKVASSGIPSDGCGVSAAIHLLIPLPVAMRGSFRCWLLQSESS